MKALLIIGIVLFVIGAAALAYQGITYTSEETVLELGPLTATAETEETIPIHPAVGWALMVGGGVAVIGAFIRSKKS